MKRVRSILAGIAVLASLLSLPSGPRLAAQSPMTRFSYPDRLTRGANPVNATRCHLCPVDRRDGRHAARDSVRAGPAGGQEVAECER